MADGSERRWPYVVGAVAMLLLFAATQLRFGDPRPTGSAAEIAALADRDDLNLVFLLIDTLRADRLGSYGYARDTSPNLDRLAASGIRFPDHRSQSSWTKTSMASLWSGLRPGKTGVLRAWHVLPEEATLPAEILLDAGFRTAGIWRNGWVAPNFGFSQGFEFYTQPSPRPLPAGAQAENPAAGVLGSDLDVIQSAAEFVRSVDPDERWFLYLHLMDVHQYVSDPDSARFGTTYSDFYDAAIHWTDRLVGSLLEALDERGQLLRTVVVVASDHGEAFREHQGEGHARDLYTEVTRTPWILSLPFALDGSSMGDIRATSNVDIWPTLLDLLGLPGLPDADGRSLRPEILAAASAATPAEPNPLPRVAYLDAAWGRAERAPAPIIAVDEGPLRAILGHRRYRGRPSLELFDHSDDPTERHDLAAARAADAERLGNLARSFLEGDQPRWEAREVELDAMLLSQLRALGYDVE